VIEGLVERTRSFLNSRRDDEHASFLLSSKHLDSFGGAPADVTHAYILWSLSSAGYAHGLDSYVQKMYAEAVESSDPYLMALAAGTMFNIADARGSAGTDASSATENGEPPSAGAGAPARASDATHESSTTANSLKNGARLLAARLVKYQDGQGKIAGARTSITSSFGDALDIETTSLTVLTWLRADSSPGHDVYADIDHGQYAYAAHTHRAVGWLSARCKDGRFSSTQATVLALKALVAFDGARSASMQAGQVTLTVDGALVQTLSLDKATTKPLEFGGVEQPLSVSGTHVLELAMSNGSKLPFTSAVEYHASQPETGPHQPQPRVALDVHLQPRTQTAGEFDAGETGQHVYSEGDVIEIIVKVRNVQSHSEPAVLPMTVAVVGLPGGLEVRMDQLQELRQRGDIAAYEMSAAHELVLYWRTLRAKIDLRIETVASAVGTYTGERVHTLHRSGYLQLLHVHK
jgi:hypothetical protein